MRKLWSLALVVAIPLVGCGAVPDDGDKMAEELNVNSRYIIENVGYSGGGWRTDISPALRSDLDRVAGAKYDDSALRTLADRIKKELRGAEVKVNVVRGTDPEHVVVNFEVREQHFDMLVGKFAYDSKEGWTGDGSATTSVHGNDFTVGLVSDATSMVERFAGVRAMFARNNVGTKRLKLRFEFDDYHEQWNNSTLAAAGPGDIYRSRQDFMPEATLVLFATAGMGLRRQLRALKCSGFYSNGEPGRCGGENRILQRGGKYSALPPALGIGKGRAIAGCFGELHRDRGHRHSA